jgi:hypothetical protein
MILDEKHAVGWVNNKKYPFFLGTTLLMVAMLSMFVTHLTGAVLEKTWMIGGTELLLYLLANAISCLIVTDLRNYLIKTIVMYICNFAGLLLAVYVLHGSAGFAYSEIKPIYAALLMCFFLSILLAVIIRKALSVLKE